MKINLSKIGLETLLEFIELWDGANEELIMGKYAKLGNQSDYLRAMKVLGILYYKISEAYNREFPSYPSEQTINIL